MEEGLRLLSQEHPRLRGCRIFSLKRCWPTDYGSLEEESITEGTMRSWQCKERDGRGGRRKGMGGRSREFQWRDEKNVVRDRGNGEKKMRK